MKNKTQLQNMAQELNDTIYLEKIEVEALYDLMRKSDDKETSLDYKEHMLLAKRELNNDTENSVYNALYHMNIALQVVGVKLHY